MIVPTLDFRALDDVAFAAQLGKLGNIPAAYRLRADLIGPLLELLHLQRSGLLPPNPHWLEDGYLTDLQAVIIAGQEAWASDGYTRVRMMKLAPLAMSNEWAAFAMEARRAAVFAGFDTSWAGQLIAAIRELENNVRDHSGAVESAYIAIRASAGIFEFVVADEGKGVLETLRQAADFVNLTSDGDALRATLSEGVSRGFGYAPLFTGLVNRRATLRFRSGCGSLVMDGVTPALPSAQIGVKPRCPGLFISVCCYAN
jgi:anti-sigma regulatory factor (Ser/Thr protein kinase)